MLRLRGDLQAHRPASVVFLGYWLATIAVSLVTGSRGMPTAVVVLLLTPALIAGFLVGRWRAPPAEQAIHWRERVGGGVLSGALSAVATLLVMKGGVVEEVIGWMRGGGLYGQWGEVLGFTLAAGVLGAVLGLVGTVIATAMDRARRFQ